MSISALNSFENLPDGSCPHSSSPPFVLCVWLRKLPWKHTICCKLFYFKGKIICPSELYYFFLLSLCVEVIPCKSQLEISFQRLKPLCLNIQICMCTHIYLARPSYRPQCNFLLILKFTGTPKLRILKNESRPLRLSFGTYFWPLVLLDLKENSTVTYVIVL